MANSKRVVPWSSMEEWGRVFQQVYSENTQEKWSGLNTMTMWKSRVAKLPLGVECSLYLLQAILRDEEYKVNPKGSVSENDVVLMYSTAIIRFINLISHLGQVDLRHQPISAIAEMAGIPDWLVGIRHEATHAKMPSLEILRPGAQLAMEWLKDNYWRTEEDDSFDLYWPESKTATSRMLRAKKKMTEVGKRTGSAPTYEVIPEELQLAVSMLVALLKEMVSRQLLNEIRSLRDLHKYAYELWLSTKTLTAPLNEKSIANLCIPLTKVRRLIMTEIERILSEWVETDGGDTEQLNTAKIDALKGKCLISALCQCPGLFELSAKGTVFAALMPIWKMVNQWRSVPYLMNKLATIEIENDKDHKPRLKLISDLTVALVNARKCPKDGTNLFTYDEGLQSADWNKMVRTILEEPHPETWATVSKLFELCDPPVTGKRREKVATLLRLYLAKNSLAEPPKRTAFGQSTIQTQIYSVETLIPHMKESGRKAKAALNGQQPAGNNSPAGPAQVIDEWTLCSEPDWSRIPIGSLPGHLTQQLELKGIEWEVVEAELDDSDSDRLLNGLKRTGERFDWNSLMRKRRRRGGLTKEGPVAHVSTAK